MADLLEMKFDLSYYPALSGLRQIGSRKLRLTPLDEGIVLQVFAPSQQQPRLAAIAASHDLAQRANGPGQWFLVGGRLADPSAMQPLLDCFPDECTVVDQSHGRVRIAIEGEAVDQVLAKGTGIDLARMEVGDASSTLIGHIATHLTRTADDRFELMTLRTFAESLWHDLERMGAEHLASESGN